jgi:hypothetical protein
MTVQQYFQEMDGCEVRTNAIETDLGVVLIDNGQIIIDGKSYPKSKITKKLMKEIWDDYFFNEFGTNDVNSLL